MRRVIDTIRDKLCEPDAVFVFPSEVAASFWRRRSLSLTNRRSVRYERFISWDTYKERFFDAFQDATPVNRQVRLLFMADLLRKNAENPFLSAIILPEIRKTWRPFVRYFARTLPILDGMLHDGSIQSALSIDLRSDYLEIRKRYGDFLKNHDLYEPGYESPTGGTISAIHTVFFPTVIQDFAEFKSLIRASNVSVVDVGSPVSRPILRFANAKLELRWMCVSIMELLRSGADPGDIAVTLADLAGYEDELREHARRYDLPFDFHLGKSLSNHPEARLYPLLSACFDSGFSARTLKELFLNRTFPWRDSDLGIQLAKFGIEHHGLQNFTSGNDYHDLWQARLSSHGTTRLLAFYKRFSQAARRIVRSRNMKELRRRILAFSAEWLDSARFSTQALRIYSAALDELPKLEESEDTLKNIDYESPFSLWQMSLADRVYVQPSSLGGIPVYPYRVSAGIYPKYHFLPGASHDTTTVRSPPYPFLPVTVDDGTKGDYSGAFLSLYRSSGETVMMSFGDESSSGPHLPPGDYVAQDSVETHQTVQLDSYALEPALWSGHKREVGLVYPSQLHGSAYCESTFGVPRELDITGTPLGVSELNSRIMQRLSAENGEILITPSSAQSWAECPFAYLFVFGLGLAEVDYDVRYYDPREVGILTHRILSRIIGDTADVNVLEEHIDLSRMLYEEFSKWERTMPVFLPIQWSAVKQRVEE